MTGITNLDFLSNLQNLSRLILREFSLENVEAVYSLPNLKYLVVNKPVARLIDKKRLKKVYGEKINYRVEDYTGIVPIPVISLPMDKNHNMSVPRFVEAIKKFTTCELANDSLKTKLCSQIYAGTKRYLIGDKEFCIVDESCDGTDRTRLYEDINHYLCDEYSWYITYEGTSEDDLSELDTKKVFAISILKRDHGLKLIAMAVRIPSRERTQDDPDGNRDEQAYRSWYVHIMYLMNNNVCWAEISGELEKKFIRACTMKDVIEPSVLVGQRVIKSLEIDADDYHYYRADDSGKKMVKKICYGHIETE